MPTTISGVLAEAKDKLNKTSYTPQLDSELLLSHILKIDRETLFLKNNDKLTLTQINRFNKLVKRRLEHDPIAYIINNKEFFGISLYVNKHVLIPRPDTEVLVENVLDLFKSNQFKKPLLIDIGTGSGCIPIAISKHLPQLEIWASDICKNALKVAAKNIKTTNSNIKLIHSDLLKDIQIPQNKEIILTANLPYINPDHKLEKNVLLEPKKALFSENKGLAHYEKLFNQCSEIKPQAIFIEISPEQEAGVEKLVKQYLSKYNCQFFKDLGRMMRIVSITSFPVISSET